MPVSPDQVSIGVLVDAVPRDAVFPKARVVAVAEYGTHAFLAADTYAVGEKTLAQRMYPRPRPDELLTADGASTPGRPGMLPPRPRGQRCAGGHPPSSHCLWWRCWPMAPTCRW